MDKIELRAAARAVMRASQSAFAPPDAVLPRTSREPLLLRARRERKPPSLDKSRARQACAPMGALHSIVVTVDARKRRRTWYVLDPDVALSAQYAAAGLDLTPGCKVLVDAEAMRPVALLEVDPLHRREPQARGDDAPAQDESSMPQGFNPYFDLPAG